MPTLRSILSIAVTALALLGCKPPGTEEQPAEPVPLDDAAQILAEKMCAQLFACECPNTGNYASESDCVDQERESIQMQIDFLLGEVGGGTWDEACAGKMTAAWSEWACMGPTLASQAASFNVRACPIIKGEVEAGLECQQFALGDTCAPGLTCLSGVCVSVPAIPVPLGQQCEYDWEQLPCEAGSYCTYDEAAQVQICTAYPQDGESCPSGWCGPNALDLVCNAETLVCEPAPGEGESCADYPNICAPGFYCDGGLDFTCAPRMELGDGCGADTVCPVDASCLNNICVADAPLVCNVPNAF